MRGWKLLLPIALVLTLVQLWRGHALAWDEIEFFRATRWIGEGRVPFRDFWEHHLPLQWIVFAPLARWLADGPGVESVLMMRLAQIPLWIATFALLLAIARRELGESASRWGAIVLLLAAPSFTNAAIEYRVDTVGNLAFIAALAIAILWPTRWGWTAFGACMSMAVLANMRMAPLVAFVGVLMLVCDLGARRWRWSARPLWMSAGIAPVVVLFVGGLLATGAWPAFVANVIELNRQMDAIMSGVASGSLAPTLLAPLIDRDIAAIVFWLLGIGGCAFALREVRRPGPIQFFAILAIASVLSVAMLGVQYPYHLQNAYLLLVPLVALALHEAARRASLAPTLAAVVIAIALLVNAAPLLQRDSFGATMRYEDRIMTEVDRLTTKDDVVWDGVGYALRREPAYRYWFLPTGLRLMAAAGEIEAYSTRDLARRPPAAIVYGLRMKWWLDDFPETARWSFRHYVPLYRDLWIPGLGTRIEPRPMKIVWQAPDDGRYEIFASELLARHPWLTRPKEYLAMQGRTLEGMQIPLRQLPPMAHDALRWTVDGHPVAPGTRFLTLRRGSRVELTTSANVPAGVLVVPVGIETLCLPAPDRFIL